MIPEILPDFLSIVVSAAIFRRASFQVNYAGKPNSLKRKKLEKYALKTIH